MDPKDLDYEAAANYQPPEPHDTPRSHRAQILLIVIVAILSVSGIVYGAYMFSSEIHVAPSVCEYNGQIYQPNEMFDASDGCNTCGCSEGGEVACTEKACEDQAQTSLVAEAFIGYAVENADGGYSLMLSLEPELQERVELEYAVWADEDDEPIWELFVAEYGATVQMHTYEKGNVYVEFRNSNGDSKRITFTQDEIENEIARVYEELETQ